jgi:predicted DNA-binding transcriptional regulator AlpA
MSQDTKVRRALRLEAVLEATGESKSGWYEGIKKGIYPAPTKVNPNGRNAIWWDDEIAEVQARAISRRAAEVAKASERQAQAA